MKRHVFYITGTDTNAGKTWVSTECLKVLCASGVRAIGMKPLASGCENTSEGLRNDDALKLIAASTIALPYHSINPIALRDPTAPEIASKHDGITISLEPVLQACEQVKMQAELVLVEGVGGWLAPLSEKFDQADLVRALNCQVILVVGLKLGCINHARLSELAIKQDGVEYVGWIAADVDPDLLFAEEYFEALRRSMTTPLLGRVFAGKHPELQKFITLARTEAITKPVP